MTKGDKTLILIITTVSLLAMVIIFKSSTVDVEEKYVIIEIDNTIEKKIAMDNTTKANYSFSFEKGTGVIEIENGAVRMQEMDKEICPRAICSDTGWISKTYERIVCLPNVIVVRIEENQNNEIDVVS